MKMVGIRRKSDGVVIMVVPLGTPYGTPATQYPFPSGITARDVDVVPILIPETEGEYFGTSSTENIERLEKIARHFGMTVSDLVEFVAKVLRIPHCSRCQMTKIVLYAIDKIGWFAAIKLIWKIRGGKTLTEKEQTLLQSLETLAKT